MASSDGVRAIVELENRGSSKLFETFLGTDVHIWPYLRWPLVQSMASIELGTTAISAPISSVQRVAKLAKRILPNPTSFKHAPRKQKLLFVVAGRTQADSPEGRKNWLVDYFASAYAGESVVVQYRELGEPSRKFESTYSFHDAELKGDIGARLRPLSNSRRQHTRHVIESLYAELDFPVDHTGISVATAKVLRHQARVERMRAQYEWLLDRISPKVVIMDGAAYGGSRAIQVRAAKERGIPVAELQHGWVGPSHGAYNFGDAVWRQELRQYLPDFFLTFGDYWSRGVSGPFEAIAIGKPHLEEFALNVPPVMKRKQSVLVASSVSDPEEMTRSVLSIRDALPEDWQVWFRPHPSERQVVRHRYPELVTAGRVAIDYTLDVYESLSQVRGVFGYSSTVLFEALKFDCATFVLDSPLAELYADRGALGDPITSPADLDRAISLILTEGSIPRTKLDDIWAPDPIARYRQFVDAYVEQ
ncbi:MAG: hypothetical protein WED09_06055 [Homoserinimonas sp.]